MIGDRQKLMEAFTNIILNAIEAMSGGEITASSYDEEGDVAVRSPITVPEIPEENLKKIFVPFFTTKKEGTGMGLAITQRDIVAYGGNIEVKSKLGSGTTFILYFPK